MDPRNVVLNREAGTLTLTIERRSARTGGVVEQATDEYEALLARLCEKCGEPIAIYARGDAKRAGRFGSFAKPWESGHWTLLAAPGGFALVAAGGHKWQYSTSGYSYRAPAHLTPTCRGEASSVIVFSACAPQEAPGPGAAEGLAR